MHVNMSVDTWLYLIGGFKTVFSSIQQSVNYTFKADVFNCMNIMTAEVTGSAHLNKLILENEVNVYASDHIMHIDVYII